MGGHPGRLDDGLLQVYVEEGRKGRALRVDPVRTDGGTKGVPILGRTKVKEHLHDRHGLPKGIGQLEQHARRI